MTRILKRSGSCEDFDAEKIRNTLASASDDIRKPLSASSLDGIVRELEGLLEGKESATSQQLYVLVVGILYTRGLGDLADHYMNSEYNAFRSR